MISRRTTLFFSLLALAVCLALLASPVEATAAPCSQPVSTGAGPIASDCLFILSAAVGLQTCGCECDPNGDSRNTAADALTCLNIAVGVDLPLACPCGGTTSTTNTTVTTSTTTTTTGGGPLDPRDLIGLVTASRDRNVSSNPFPAFGLPIEESFSLGGAFGKFTDPGEDPNTKVTTEEIGGCTVTTVEQVTDLGGGGMPGFTPLDPGSPGTASNGSVELDLPATGFGAFAPTEDPFAEGFDGGQTIQFSWPGGSDIDAFSDSITVPPTVEITAPDIADDAFDIVPGQAIDVSWIPGPDQDGDITILVSTSTTQTIIDGTDVTLKVISVTVLCDFADNSGNGTVPSAATSKLQSSAPMFGSLSKAFSATRQNLKAVSVDAPNVSGPDQVGFFGLSTMTRAISGGFSFP